MSKWKYKSLSWIHKIRRENYKKTKGLSPAQIIEQTKHEAESIRKKLMRSRAA